MGDLLATAAGLLQAGGFDQLQPGRYEFEDLADVLADQAQGAAAFRAVVAGVQHDAFTRRACRDQGLATTRRVRGCGLFFSTQFDIIIGCNRADRCRPGNLQILQCQFKLFDIALDTFRAGAKLLLLQPCDLDLQRLDQRLMGAQGGAGWRRVADIFSISA